MTIKSLAIQTTIVDGIATTELTEVLHNNSRVVQEGTWLLPLPQDAVADGFEMTVDGNKMKSEVLDANTARGIYEDLSPPNQPPPPSPPKNHPLRRPQQRSLCTRRCRRELPDGSPRASPPKLPA